MEKFKRSASLLMVLVMLVLAMTACQGAATTTTATTAGTTAGTTAATTAATTTAATTTAATTTAATTAAGDPNLNEVGTFPICKEQITVTGIIEQPSWISDMVENDEALMLQKKTNIKLDLQVVPSEGYADKLKISLTTGDYPEVIFSGAGGNNEVMTYGIKEKIYIPLTEYVNSKMPNLALRLGEMPEIKVGATAPDGNIYIFPAFEGMAGHGAVWYKMWMNTEWLTKVGKTMPTTTDELVSVLQAFKTMDPNGNGKADEVPLSGAVNTWAAEPYLSILNAFDYYDISLLKLKDNTFTGCANTDGIKEGLKFLAGLYKDGLLDPASLTQDLAQLGQLGSADPAILGSFTAGHVGMGIDVANLALSTAYQHVLPLKGPTGYQGVPAYAKQTINGGPTAITDKCQNPEAVARMLDLRYSETYMIDASPTPDWLPADPGKTGVTGLPAKFKQNPNTDFSHGGKKNGWPGVVSYGGIKNAKLYLQFEGDINSVENYEARLIKATEEYLKLAADADQIMPMWASTDVALELSNMYTPISDYVKSSIVDFISGTKDVEADWAAYLDGLEKLGYSKYIADYSAAYFVK